MSEEYRNRKLYNINVLFVLQQSAINRGMNTGLENLAWGLAEQGVGIHILSGGSRPNSHKYNFSDNVIYHFTGKSGKNPMNYIDTFKEILSRYQLNAVIGWSNSIAPLISVVKDKKIKFISNEGQIATRLIYLSFLKKALLRKMPFIDCIKSLYYIIKFRSYVNTVISISNSVQQSCVKTYGFDPDKCRVIPRGVDTDTFSFQEKKEHQGKTRILYAGNIQKSKGINDLVDSLEYLDEPVQVTLCGKGDPAYMKSLKDKIKSYNFGHDLMLAGMQSQENMIQYLHKSDIFVFVSHSEGLGKALIESMSCGCAIVCSDISTFREVVLHEYDGLITAVKSPENLAATIMKYIKKSDLRKQCGLNARKTVEERFSKKNEINSWIKVLEGLQS